MTLSASVDHATPAEAARRALERARAALGADGGALVLMDPVTGLFTTGAVDALPAATCHPFFASELADGDRTFRRMAADRTPASGVSLDEHPDDEFVRVVLGPAGYAAEARAVCFDGPAAWGGITLWRREGRPVFRDADLVRLDRLAGALATELREAVVRSLAGPRTGDTGDVQRAMVVLEAGEVVELSPDAHELLRELGHPADDEYRHLDHLRVLATDDPRFSAVIRTSEGWLTAHGTPLGGLRVAVTITSAGPERLLGARVVAAGLSAREVEVTRLLCRGLSDREIARELGVSSHTVHDHVRAVRRKLGVRSRAEVSATIFAERYFDDFLSTAEVSHAG